MTEPIGFPATYQVGAPPQGPPTQQYPSYNLPPNPGMPPIYPQRPAPKPTAPVWVWVALGTTAAVFGLLGLFIGIELGKSGSNPIAVVTGHGTFTASGDLVVTDSDGLGVDHGGIGSACSGTNGYSDIAQGAQVVIYDASGKSLAIGALQQGEYYGADGCQFKWSVTGIPSGVGPYSVQVTHRGMVVFTQDKATNQQLSIGS